MNSQFQHAVSPSAGSLTALPTLDQSTDLVVAAPPSEPSTSATRKDKITLETECIRKPELVIRRSDMQLDFSFLGGAIGNEFAQLLGHKIVDAPPMTIVRVYNGEYGTAVDECGKLQTGGLQQHIQKLDRALASTYPIEIHVIHRSYTDDLHSVIKEEDWPGVIHLHAVKDFGVQPETHSELVKSIARQVGADLVHMHISDTRLAALVAEKSEKTGLVVTFHNGLVTADSDLPVSAVRATDIGAVFDVARTHLVASGVFRGTLEALKEIVSKVRCRIFSSNNYATLVYDRAASRADNSTFFAAGLLSVSKHNQLEFANRRSAVIGVPMDVSMFDPDAVSAERKQVLREELGVAEKRILFCHGRVDALKGQQYLPAVAARLEKISPADFTIIIVGPSRDLSFRDELREQIADHGVAHRFILLDGKPNEFVRDVLAISDVMLFPTRIEALGGAGIEAGLLRVPVVGHHVGGVPEVVVDGKSGYLLPVGDTTGMASRTAELLENEQLRISMGSFAREHCVNRFNAVNIATRYVELVYGPQVLGSNQVR